MEGCCRSGAICEQTCLMRRQSGHKMEKAEWCFGAQIQGFSRLVGAKKALDKVDERE